MLVDRGCGCRVPAGHQPPTAGRLQASMVMHDPPEHARLRRAISWASSYGLDSMRLMLLAEKPEG